MFEAVQERAVRVLSEKFLEYRDLLPADVRRQMALALADLVCPVASPPQDDRAAETSATTPAAMTAYATIGSFRVTEKPAKAAGNRNPRVDVKWSNKKTPPRGSLGERLRTLRESAGLSQRDLAKKIGDEQPRISAIERGAVRHPGPGTIGRLANALGVSARQLTGETA